MGLTTALQGLSLLVSVPPPPLSLSPSVSRPAHLEVRLHRELLERSRVRQALRDDLAGEVINDFDQELSHNIASPPCDSLAITLPPSFWFVCWCATLSGGGSTVGTHITRYPEPRPIRCAPVCDVPLRGAVLRVGRVVDDGKMIPMKAK